MAKTYKFRLLTGTHNFPASHPLHKVGGYKEGEVIDGTVLDLAAKFGSNKFLLLATSNDTAAPAPEGTTAPTDAPAAADGTEGGDTTPLAADGPHPFGDDVTEIFEEECTDLLKVYKKKGKYYVVRADEDDVPLHGIEGRDDKTDHFTSRAQVSAFIAKYKSA